MQKFNKQLFFTLGLGIALAACSKDDNGSPKGNTGGEGESKGKSRYVIAASPVGSLGEAANYLVTADSLHTGTVTTTGNGIEQDGYRYYAFHKNKLFSLLYGQGNPGAVTAYTLDTTGKLTRVANLLTETVQVFGKVDNDLLLVKVPRSGDANAGMFRVNADTPRIVGSNTINTINLAGNGERAHFTGAYQVGNKVYMPYYTIKGITGAVFHTDYTDSTWIAVFSYPGLQYERTIKDNRTSYIGYYFAQNGLKVTENGDIYAFSGAVQNGAGVKPSTKPSAIVRIKSGASDFDKSYFFNVQEKAGGRHLKAETYFGNGKFLVSFYVEPGKTEGFIQWAVVDVINQSLTWVTGAPPSSAILHVSMFNSVEENGKTIGVGITTAEGTWIYNFEAATAKATRGLKVEAGSVTGLGKLKY
ncbi:uncharacterized protein DUF4374 [Chitinophaga skermanii]|uniref:Uncharacterized protein DUF4374 n=1 Tax=Chitinophaga skermanii TaxID=331697 RepID=A0A327Q2Z0_9BACT|nr:DUF4374 domain-containing protein [Chitinophaga skermanii]RAI97562.1 uncharacterized protein DUF4374 [Chitinophaga skermanii]